MCKITTALSSALITCIVAVLNYFWLENYSGMIRLVVIVMSALASGVCQGLFVDDRSLRATGFGAFFGLLVLMSPVIAATYGFALMSLPLLAMLAMLVFFGAVGGRTFRSKFCRSV